MLFRNAPPPQLRTSFSGSEPALENWQKLPQNPHQEFSVFWNGASLVPETHWKHLGTESTSRTSPFLALLAKRLETNQQPTGLEVTVEAVSSLLHLGASIVLSLVSPRPHCISVTLVGPTSFKSICSKQSMEEFIYSLFKNQLYPFSRNSPTKSVLWECRFQTQNGTGKPGSHQAEFP